MTIVTLPELERARFNGAVVLHDGQANARDYSRGVCTPASTEPSFFTTDKRLAQAAPDVDATGFNGAVVLHDGQAEPSTRS